MNNDFATLLIDWFEENKREMPWRKTSDPYCIWVSEVMLQQTQVATVIPYYIRFMERFPTVTDLAEATLEDVHQYWQGLGYYRRGENLWKGAKVIQERWNGEFPRDPKRVSEIPGIGPYTLGAICSIAFHLPLPAVDGNVMRVMSRWYCISDDIGIAKNRKIFEAKVMDNMPDNPNAFNQGLMELGALICTPKNPKCEECPVKSLCKAYQTGTVSDYPVKEKKLKKVEEKYHVLIIEKDHKIGMIKRPEEGLLANLWGLPMIEEDVWKKKGFEALEYVQFDEVNHIFTHKKWIMTPIAIKWSKVLETYLKSVGIDIEEITYFYEEELKEIPIATAFKKVLKPVQIKLK
ncbi:MAG: A/G-specific adenine glycosylase [Cellulosilyticum sp.]|nr:A/G-specific adenine glycosylase [Cellulosilyticum sp.]